MPVIETKRGPGRGQYDHNREEMLALIEEVRGLEQAVRDASARKADKFAERGQLLPRDRVARLLDPDSSFLELSTLAGYRMHDDDGRKNIAGGGSIIGIGQVEGRQMLVTASDSAIKGGSISPMGLRKSLRAQEIALENRLPMVNLVESGGANLMYQSELFVEGGRVFANMARLSAAGIPQITVVHGSSTAGGAYLPGLSDYVVAVRGRSKIFLAGPPLVKAALGEDVSDEELGGAEMHATVSGTAEYLADDDAHAIDVCRELISNIEWDRPSPPPYEPRPPRHDPDELCGVVPVEYRHRYDCREIVARVVDDSEFLEFKAGYGPQIVCGHARIGGYPCGIIGNNGPIYPESSAKATHFIQACCQSGTPLIYLQNTTGYMVGARAEADGAIKHGAKMIQAVANATVPQITLLVGGAFGAGNYGMCGRSYGPRFIFSWPNARIAVMGGGQAAAVMELITRAKHERLGMPVDDKALEQMASSIRDRLDRESRALYATARVWDDGIIDPRDTREVLARTLAIARDGDARSLRPNTFGVARI